MYWGEAVWNVTHRAYGQSGLPKRLDPLAEIAWYAANLDRPSLHTSNSIRDAVALPSEWSSAI